MRSNHIVLKKNLPNNNRFGVYDDSGKLCTRRRTMFAAEEAARMLDDGVGARELPKERLQILRRLPAVVVVEDDNRYPYSIRTAKGTMIKRFLLDFQARWWQRAYMWRRQCFKDEGRTTISWTEVSSMYDELERGHG